MLPNRSMCDLTARAAALPGSPVGPREYDSHHGGTPLVCGSRGLDPLAVLAVRSLRADTETSIIFCQVIGATILWGSGLSAPSVATAGLLSRWEMKWLSWVCGLRKATDEEWIPSTGDDRRRQATVLHLRRQTGQESVVYRSVAAGQAWWGHVIRQLPGLDAVAVAPRGVLAHDGERG